MQPARHQSMIKNSANNRVEIKSAQVKKGISPKFMLASLLSLGILLLATQLTAAESNTHVQNVSPAENWYAKKLSSAE